MGSIGAGDWVQSPWPRHSEPQQEADRARVVQRLRGRGSPLFGSQRRGRVGAPGKPPERPPSARPRGDAEGTMPNSQVGSGRAGVCAAGTAGRVCSALCRDARASPRGAGAFPVRGASAAVSAAVSPASPGGACERLGPACRQRRASAPRPQPRPLVRWFRARGCAAVVWSRLGPGACTSGLRGSQSDAGVRRTQRSVPVPMFFVFHVFLKS